MARKPAGAAPSRRKPRSASSRRCARSTTMHEVDADQERIEIPAFLRRQAN